MQSPQSREKFNEQDSRSNSRVHASESDNENTAETTKSTCTATNLTDLFATNHIRIELNETAESPPKGSPLLPPLKKTYHETPWENELELTIPDTHQFCKDYPDLTIDLSFYHSLSDDTSDLQGDPEDTRVTDAYNNFIQPPIPSQQCSQTRLLRRKDPSIILSKELRLHPPRVSVCGLTSHREKTPDNYDEYK